MTRVWLFSLCCLLLPACYQSQAVDGNTNTDSGPDTGPDMAPDSGTAPDTAPDTGVAPDTDIDTDPVIPVENEWIFIEGGTFEMGHVCDPPPRNNVACSSEPVHTVPCRVFTCRRPR